MNITYQEDTETNIALPDFDWLGEDSSTRYRPVMNKNFKSKSIW